MLSYTWAAEEYSTLDISFISCFTVNKHFFIIFWSPYYWRNLWSRKEGVRRDHNDWSTDTLESILNMSLKSASFFDEPFFLVKSKSSGFGTTLLICSNIKISKLSDIRLKEFCCIIFITYLLSNLLIVLQNSFFRVWKASVDKLTLILLMWRIWWAPNNASKRQMGFNVAFKELNWEILLW